MSGFSVFDQAVHQPRRRIGGQRPGEPKPRAGHENRPLTRRRLAVGLTQSSLAELAGVSADTLGRWEAGQRKPHPKNRARVLRALRLVEEGRA